MPLSLAQCGSLHRPWLSVALCTGLDEALCTGLDEAQGFCEPALANESKPVTAPSPPVSEDNDVHLFRERGGPQFGWIWTLGTFSPTT